MIPKELKLNHPVIRETIDKFNRAIRNHRYQGGIRYGRIFIYSDRGIGGGNDIHYDYQIERIEFLHWLIPFLMRVPLSVYRKRTSHNGYFTKETIRFKRFIRYLPEIEEALDHVEPEFQMQAAERRYKQESRVKKKSEKLNSIVERLEGR